MIRMLIPLVIIFLVYLLAQTFMQRSSRDTIDVDPIDPSTDREEKARKKQESSTSTSDDDIIDVEPL